MSGSGAVGPLAGRVCLVTGASRGIGRGIALQLGQAGATVYITGRTMKAKPGNFGSLEDTAAEVERRGGRCIPIQCDHTKDEDIQRVFDTISRDQDGRLDVLINNAYSAVNHIFSNIKIPFWEQDPSTWDIVNNVGLRNHYICSVHASRLMVPRKSGLIVNVSSGGALRYLFSVPYGVGKEACDRLAADCAVELRKHNVASVSLWPGAVQTEIFMEINDKLQQQESQKLSGQINKDMMQSMIQRGESTELAGKCVVALASDKNVMSVSGKVLWTADLADKYGFVDINGSKPLGLNAVKAWALHAGYNKVAACIPRFIKVPKWIVWLSSNRL